MRGIVSSLIVASIAGGVYLFYLWQIPPRGISPESDRMETESGPCAGKPGKPTYLTRQTCDSPACHGAIAPAEDGTILRNEYHTWFDRDRHADALRVLGNPVSSRMVARLAGNDPKPETYQRIYRRCFACHNTTTQNVPSRLITSEAEFDRKPEHEGVGCQACHGPASQWENLHYLDCWKQFSKSVKRSYGFRDTQTLSSRAEICVRCHVGDSRRDVNHDLIAAGHPQMKFEMSGYHQLMTAHWNTERDRGRHVDFQRRLWAAGQLASVSAALELLEQRANQAAESEAETAIWPEFSEYDCFACHHDLDGRSWRQQRGFHKSRGRVMPPWGVWYFSLLPELASESPGGGEFFAAYSQLQSTMENRLVPDAGLVKDQASSAQAALKNWQEAEALTAAVEEINRLLISRGQRETFPRTWDEAVQLYLAANAILRDAKPRLPQNRAKILEDQLLKLRNRLGFPEGYLSPRPFPAGVDSPGDVRPLLMELLKNLPSNAPGNEEQR